MKMPANTNKDANVHENVHENATKIPRKCHENARTMLLKKLVLFLALATLVDTTQTGLFLFVFESLLEKSNLLKEKTCFQNKSKFITEDHFAKCVNITIH